LFYDSAALYFHRDHLTIFLNQWISPIDLLKSVEFDINEKIYLAEIRALGAAVLTRREAPDSELLNAFGFRPDTITFCSKILRHCRIQWQNLLTNAFYKKNDPSI
jgi:hypothetical protein